MRIDGTAFPPRSAMRHEAVLDLSQPSILVLHVNGEVFNAEHNCVAISDSVGQLPVRISFPNGWVFVTEPCLSLTQWRSHHKKSSFVASMEGSIPAWILSALICLGVIVGGYYYLLPWGSKHIAERLPDSLSVAVGEQVLASLDLQFAPSDLPIDQQQEIRRRVAQWVTVLPELPNKINVEFRSLPEVANAFALPGGTIVLLDDLVALAQTQQQLDGIILHEIGHVYHRHMMTRVVHSTILSVAVSLITGESSGIVDNLAGVGVFIASNGQSREAERQADQYAKNAMQQIYGNSDALAEMFELFKAQEEIETPEWFRSHPNFTERIEAVKNK
ncbi:M48 family metalloprotease [Vibrio sp. V27_P1S3P104]|uniref:M48 family metallopeptidase n=1 Tax=Vibrio TaxID=662 RepID=UPI000C171DE4|nr:MULTISPECIES: M48 family metallopeptidase [Vibrio]NAW69462.1 M48 family metalloprotease [Vibrio sp. V28_P6S34P95]NAX06412.1 M48 family metalloprotease [Vibrio sp. V30_P3S12P165]NAX33110.1 M48 family metalloprotease [Vibrio sp. V29_P1S30P107]NAX36209.1 M48 family metalloprotease [Vibrio sp. V27_P1S3P104]NAX40192.1 M48 family metalloprotease [Vibrio sp. V26_P1S5P106]